MIALTLGGDGAILATADGALQLPAIAVKERTGVGAGDAFLAGLVLGLARGQSCEEALRLAIAAGAAAVAGIGTARVQRADIEALYRGFRLEEAEFSVQAFILRRVTEQSAFRRAAGAHCPRPIELDQEFHDRMCLGIHFSGN